MTLKNCNNCYYSTNHDNALFCMGQKGMPHVQETESCASWKSKNITNADKIRSMTDEKLSEWIVNILNKGCPHPISDCIQDCKLCWIYWLKSEVKV